MHIGNTPKLALESGRQDDDGHLRAVTAERFRQRSQTFRRLDGSQDRDIDFMQPGLSLFDGIGGDDQVALLAKNRRTQDEFSGDHRAEGRDRRNRDRLRSAVALETESCVSSVSWSR